jgi:ketosteroid isomerase-like protein
MGTLTVGLILATGWAADEPAKGIPKEIQAELKKAADAYNAAIKDRDEKALDKLVDADGRFVDEKGKVFTKKEWVAELVKQSVVYDSITDTTIAARLIGETAIGTGTWVATGKRDGKPVKDQLRYTVVWVKKGGGWVLNAEQSTPITDTK